MISYASLLHVNIFVIFFQDLREFATLCQKSREEFAGCEAFLRTCSYTNSQELIKNFKEKVSELEDRSRNLVELQELLEANIVDFTCIAEFRNDIETLEKVWVKLLFCLFFSQFINQFVNDHLQYLIFLVDFLSKTIIKFLHF